MYLLYILDENCCYDLKWLSKVVDIHIELKNREIEREREREIQLVWSYSASYPADFTDLDDVDLLLEDKRNFVPTDPEADWIHAESVPFNRDNLMTINRRSVFNWRRPGSRPQFVIPFYRIGDGINYLFDSGVRPTRFGSSRSRMAPYRGIRPY